MIVRKIKVNEYEYQPPINYVAGATEPDIQFQLTDYIIPSGAEARAFVQRFDGTFEYTVATIDDQNITIEPTSSMFSVKGEGAIQVTLYVGDEVVKNFSVPVFVHADLADDAAQEGRDIVSIFHESEQAALEQFREDAEEIAEEVIESIPSDYTTLSNEVDELNERLTAIEEGGIPGGSGLTDDIKEALLQLASKVAYIDDGGQDYYDDLFDALYPPVPATSVTLNNNSLQFNSIGATSQLSATVLPSNTTDTASWTSSDPSVATVSSDGLVTSVALGSATITATAGNVSATCSVVVAQATVSSISAVFTQSGTVYNTDDLDILKDDLVVTATWSDSSTTTVASADYTLSGTLTVGTSSVTVNYAGKTTTFNVTVTASPYLYYWDFTKSLDDKINGVTASITNCTRTSSGIEFNTAASAAAHMPEGNQYIELGDVFGIGKTIEMEFADVEAKFGNVNANIIEFWDGENDPGTYNAFGWRYSSTATNRGWGLITTDQGSWGYAKSDIKTTKTFLDGSSCKIKLVINATGQITIYKDGTDMEVLKNGSKLAITTVANAKCPIIGSKLYYPNFYNLTVKNVKIYATEV